ncbi:hypothetical protein [Sulfurimonas sp.]|uniref:hypothetical protein n=1 Tax=Sulfurimonas sp. TaxID=2022749 RepID=UPI00262FA825|nr:hypothetical protein [Sulfurimonas sp.]
MKNSYIRSLFLLTFFLLFTTSLNAGEVDNYYAWGGEIQDSSKPFNKYLNAAIDDALGSVNKKWDTPSCEEAAMTIMKKLGSNNYLIKRVGALNADLEIWAQDNPEIDKIPRQGESLDDYVLHSIYAPKLKIFGVPSKLDVVVNVGGVYFWTDKLSNFLGSGFEIFRRKLSYYGRSFECQVGCEDGKWHNRSFCCRCFSLCRFRIKLSRFENG